MPGASSPPPGTGLRPLHGLHRHLAWFTVLAGVVRSVPFSWPHVAAGLTLSAVTHYAADHRTQLRRLAFILGKGSYWDNGGAAPLDLLCTRPR